ncbi:MAG: hypothetical protein E7773_12725 [Sphingomonas sp.]|uniref:hypothetical protein n=1 Tax=Sphingomonas sp. TaxID=28214 RepID=UPI001215CA78|nr:hypothetical protein [Sphingomonas sp.]THD35301.1 MAG: hypothetical protein E7773_12725 [Sphingomonas sp.]
MLIDIYRSASHGDKYLAVPANSDVTKVSLPAGTDPDYHQVRPFPRQVDFNPGENRIAVDSDQVIADIQDHGYALFGATITFKIG